MKSFWTLCLYGVVLCFLCSSASAVAISSDEGASISTGRGSVTDAYPSLVETTTSKTSTTDNTTYPEYVGFIAAGVAVVFYGSNFAPVKKFETGDGMFFQWMLCTGIWLSGLIVQIVRQSTFYPYVMVGGFIWATGNICVVPIIKTIGMGLGLCIWGMFNLLGGWSSGRFGWFGINPEVPKHEVLNYVGVALAVASSFIYVFVKNSISPSPMEIQIQVPEESEPLMGQRRFYGEDPQQQEALIFNKQRSSSMNSNLTDQNFSEGQSFIDRLSPGYKRIIGVILSVTSGFLYGINFSPAIHVMDRVDGASQNSLDYVFAQYCGIFLTSSAYFFIYAMFKKNQPQVYPKVILPAIASGIMWAIATGCWFIANKTLSEPVAFPIITTIPGTIASLFWGVFVFKEIKGKRNILILLLGCAVTASGAILAGISKG